MATETALVSGVTKEPGVSGMPRLVIQNSLGRAHLYLHGATLTHFEPAGERPVIFVSRQAVYENAKPIRGGVPICWPWFGPHPSDSSKGPHGYARLSEWSVASTAQMTDGSTRVALSIKLDLAELQYEVTVGRSLTMKLTTKNTTATPLTITEALHTYLSIGDIRQISVEGLAGSDCVDRLTNVRTKQDATPIRIAAEVDRTYLNTTSAATLVDPVFNRRITVSKRGSKSTVVWNPWIEKSKVLNDLADDEYFGFVCIETANALDNAVTIAPGESHEIEAQVAIAK